MHSVPEIFGKALMLDEGEEIILPCNTYSEMEILRVSLYRQLRILRVANKEMAQNLEISRDASRKDKRFTITIRHAANVKDAFIKRKDGSIEELFEPAKELELERICKLMQEDGYSDADIEQYKKEYTADINNPC